jgi:hypothetical protein
VPSGPHTVSGEVFAFATGVIGDASIDIWVRTPFVSYSYWWANGPLKSDGIGRFEAGSLPRSKITIRAIQAGYVQPCAVDAEVHGDLSVRVELIPASTLDAFNPSRPQLSTEPSVSGVIYETTASGREPVAGANLGVEEYLDLEATMTTATTLSDRGGGFFLCNLGEEAYLQVSKPGFEEKWVGPIDSSTESRTLEIELKRL